MSDEAKKKKEEAEAAAEAALGEAARLEGTAAVELTKAKKARKYARQAFTRAHSKLSAESEKPQTQLKDINVAFNLLKEKAKELEAVDAKMFDLMVELMLDESEVASELESQKTYRSAYLQCEEEIKELNTRSQQNVQSSPPVAPQGNIVIQQEPKRNFTLPKVQIDKYDGDIRGWLRFWGQFKKIDEDKYMSKDDKFYYLQQYILPDSKASELVGSFPSCATMYDQVISSLKNRFGREELLVEFYVRELLGLVLTNAVSASSKTPLSTIFDQLETHIRALKSLGVTTDKCSAMLYPLVESSLPEDLLRTWQRQSSLNAAASASTKDNNVSPITSKDRLTRLMSFLQAEVDNEQRISMAMSGFGLKGELVNGKDKKKKKLETESKSEISTASGLLNAKETMKSECIFCGGSHDSSDCEKAKKLTLEERQQTVKRKGACS